MALWLACYPECSKALLVWLTLRQRFSSSEFMPPNFSFFSSKVKTRETETKSMAKQRKNKAQGHSVYSCSLHINTFFFFGASFSPLCIFHESFMWVSCKLFGTLNEHHVRFIWHKRREKRRGRGSIFWELCSIEPCLFTLPLRCRYHPLIKSFFFLQRQVLYTV